MSFLDKINSNRQSIVVAVSGVALGLMEMLILLRAYKLIAGRERKETPIEQRKREIEVLRRNINIQNPSYEDIQKVLSYSVKQTRTHVNQYNSDFKSKRREFTNDNRKDHIAEYLELLSTGFQEIQNIAIREQENILREAGISHLHFKKYGVELEESMRQIMKSDKDDIAHIKPISLEEAKFAVRKQVEFIKSEGIEYAELIRESIKNWPKEKRMELPTILSMLVVDGAFEGFPQIDEEQVLEAEIRFEKELMGEIQELQIALTPVLLKINSGSVSENTHEYPSFPFSEAVEFSQEQLQELKKLYEVRPETLEKIIENKSL